MHFCVVVFFFDKKMLFSRVILLTSLPHKELAPDNLTQIAADVYLTVHVHWVILYQEKLSLQNTLKSNKMSTFKSAFSFCTVGLGFLKVPLGRPLGLFGLGSASSGCKTKNRMLTPENKGTCTTLFHCYM